MKKTLLSIAIASSLILVGCGDANNQKQGQGAAPLVKVVSSQTAEYQQNKSFIGRIQAVNDVSITAQVTGYLTDRMFDEGQMVEKGDPLYQIESAPFEAEVATAKAAVAQAEASLKKAQMDFKRGKNLLPKGNISQSEFDALTAALLSAEAQVEAGKAQLNLAEVNLSHTTILAPFTGRISSSNVSLGDLLSPSIGELTSIVSLDPIHAAFSVSERERLQFGMDRVDGAGEGADLVEVVILTEDDKEFPYKGHLDFIGNRIDVTTGTISLRASIPNPEHTLLPGQHANISIQEKAPTDVVVIPRRAVQTDLEGDFVMVVTDGSVVERRNVNLGQQVEGGTIITQGLTANEKVVIEGLQRIRNGVPVTIASDENK
ncbi:efflux RND transporter periplasmic adaptor subunit [Vibrio sp. SCSIO 43136]|uniref:efflux RND transporter periplasmic adaptor subunit n=1 Tax=Vibrio sp. SCSIO 43136 TaxID=2819101 RepID=UPI00207568B7|nr:efflux RND transporter periplasmic adaptor subunit [Vibrio sp. SCSIO 43136]USD66813.1 efflux RND transporter periplasmic adaptor subunit [Vibrio sp. SCSIO 43136]